MFRRSSRPQIRTQIDLQRHWERLVPRFGEHRWGLRFLFITPLDTGTKVGELTNVTGPLDDEQQDAFVQLIDYFLEGDRSMWRIGLLITRPGPTTVTPHDLRWAASLYDASRRAHLACEVIHLAAGNKVLPLSPDDMPDLAVGF